jgi:hypothetical protein
MAAYNIQPFQLLQPQNPNPEVGYGGGIGNPNDYEYYVDPQTRTVKRRAKTTLAQTAGVAAPAASSGGGSSFESPFGSSGGSTWGETSGKGTGSAPGQGPSLAAQQAALTAMNIGDKMSKVPGLIGLLGYGIKAAGAAPAGNYLDQIGANYGLLDAPSGVNLGNGLVTANISDPNGNVYAGTTSNTDAIQAQNVANFGISGFDTSLGGYTGMSSENNNAGTSGSPSYGPGGFL